MVFYLCSILVLLALTSEIGAAPAVATDGQTKIIGHRGDPYYAPEHTVASFSLAIDFGVDVIEPDLVMTKDGVIMVHHNFYLSTTTNVAQEYGRSRQTTKYVNGDYGNVTDYFVEDFTLSELKQLRRSQPNEPPGDKRSKLMDGVFEMLTFVEFLTLVKTRSSQVRAVDPQRRIDIVPEFKVPSHFARVNKRVGRADNYFLTQVLLDLEQAGYPIKGDTAGQRVDSHVIGLQCFESDTLKDVAVLTDIPRIQLLHTECCVEGDTGRFHDWILTPHGLDQLAAYANALALSKRYLVEGVKNMYDYQSKDIVSRGPGVKYSESSSADVAKLGGYIDKGNLASEVHARGMSFIAYTFRDGVADSTVETQWDGLRAKQLSFFFEAGLDYIFTEKTDEALHIRDAYFSGDLELNGITRSVCTETISKKSTSALEISLAIFVLTTIMLAIVLVLFIRQRPSFAKVVERMPDAIPMTSAAGRA